MVTGRRPRRAPSAARTVATARRGTTLLATLAATVLATGCGSEPREPLPREAAAPASRPTSELPEAFALRFEHVEGTGLSREGWDLELLQVGSDIRLRGGVRTAGAYVPIFRAVDPGELADLWQWLRAFPLDGLRVVEDTTVAPPGWRKTLHYDAVLGPERRELSDNRWTRPPADPPWIQAIEDRLHLMVLELAGRELDRAEAAAGGPADTSGVLQKALEAIGEAPPPPDTSP